MAVKSQIGSGQAEELSKKYCQISGCGTRPIYKQGVASKEETIFHANFAHNC